MSRDAGAAAAAATAATQQPGSFAPSSVAAGGLGSYQPDTVQSILGAANLNPAALHPMAGLGKGVDYLNLDDAVGGATTASGQRRRGWTDELAYGTGASYFVGLSAGGFWGLYEGLSSVDSKSSMKLRVNSVLNHCTRRGPFLGNSVGVIAMMFCGTRSIIRAARGADDSLNNVLAASVAGSIFKSTAGIKPAIQWGGFGAALAATMVLGQELRKQLSGLASGGEDRATV